MIIQKRGVFFFCYIPLLSLVGWIKEGEHMGMGTGRKSEDRLGIFGTKAGRGGIYPVRHKVVSLDG